MWKDETIEDQISPEHPSLRGAAPKNRAQAKFPTPAIIAAAISGQVSLEKTLRAV